METKQLALEQVVGFAGGVKGGVAMHPDNHHIVYAIGATVVVLDVGSDHTQTLLRGHTAAVTSLCVSRSGRLVASGQKGGDIIVWDWEARAPVHKLVRHKNSVAAVGFSATDKFLVSLGGEGDNHLLVWDVETGALVCGGVAGKEQAQALDCLNRNELSLVTVGDQHCKVWKFDPVTKRIASEDVRMGASIKRVMTCVAVDAEDDGKAYVGTSTGDVLLIDVDHCVFRSHGPLNKKGGAMIQLGVQSINVARKGAVLAGAGDGVLWSLCTEDGDSMWSVLGKVKLTGAITSIAPGALGQHAFAGTAEGKMYLLDVKEVKATLRRTAPVSPISSCSFPGDCSELVVFGAGSLVSVRLADDGSERLRIEETAAADKSKPECLCVHAPKDGHSVVTGWSDGRIRAYKPESGAALYTIENAHQKGVTAILSFAADASSATCKLRLLTTGGDAEVRVWRVGPESQSLDGTGKVHKAAITGLCLSKDEKRCATCSVDGSCVLWDLNASTGSVLSLRTFFGQAALAGICFAAEDTEIVCCGAEKKVVVFEASSGRRKRDMDPGCAVTSLAVTPSGSHVVAGCTDTIIRVFEYASGALSGTCDAQAGVAKALAVAPNGKFLVSCSDNGALYKWCLDL